MQFLNKVMIMQQTDDDLDEKHHFFFYPVFDDAIVDSPSTENYDAGFDPSNGGRAAKVGGGPACGGAAGGSSDDAGDEDESGDAGRVVGDQSGEVYYLPKELNGDLVLLDLGNGVYEPTNENLDSELPGLNKRSRKEVSAKVKDDYIPWGQKVKGTDVGGGWVQVGSVAGRSSRSSRSSSSGRSGRSGSSSNGGSEECDCDADERSANPNRGGGGRGRSSGGHSSGGHSSGGHSGGSGGADCSAAEAKVRGQIDEITALKAAVTELTHQLHGKDVIGTKNKKTFRLTPGEAVVIQSDYN